LVQEFFQQTRCILVNDEFLCVQQLCYELNVNLKTLFYQIPTNLLRSYKYLFHNILNIKVNLDLNDLLNIIDIIRKKYNLNQIKCKNDFNTLINVYTLIIEQGYQCITNLYLPNCNSVLVPGRLLYMYPIGGPDTETPTNLDEYVHPAIDRRICIIAGAMNCKQPAPLTTGAPVQTQAHVSTTLTGQTHLRIFPRVFGNKRLENILSRLDDERIDIKYINLMDEGNPQIILEYLLEANRLHSHQLSTYLSDEDIFIILKYFNDFLARNYPNIQTTAQRLKELKIFKPLWLDNYINLLNQQAQSIFLISEEIAALLKRSFKQTPIQIMLLVKRNELTRLYGCLNFSTLNDLDSYINLCLPLIRKLDTKLQFNFIKYLYDEILDKCYQHDKDKCYKILRDNLYVNTKSANNTSKLISELYDFKNENLKVLLNDSYFPDSDYFDTPHCLKFLKDCGLRTFIHADLLKTLMVEIETSVSKIGEWTMDLRKRSRVIYEHIMDNWQRYDSKILDHRFLEPYMPEENIRNLHKPFEYDQFKNTCLKLSDAELCKYECLTWSSSFVLPKFIQIDNLDKNLIDFFKLNRKPCGSLINQHLMNLCTHINCSSTSLVDENTLIGVLCVCYDYLDGLYDTNNKDKDIYKQFEDKEIIWSATTKRFVKPMQICIDLPVNDEITPFLYSLTAKLGQYRQLFLRLGAKERPYPMLYGDILRKMAKVSPFKKYVIRFVGKL
jgi:hypothetical protein